MRSMGSDPRGAQRAAAPPRSPQRDLPVKLPEHRGVEVRLPERVGHRVDVRLVAVRRASLRADDFCPFGPGYGPKGRVGSHGFAARLAAYGSQDLQRWNDERPSLSHPRECFWAHFASTVAPQVREPVDAGVHSLGRLVGRRHVGHGNPTARAGGLDGCPNLLRGHRGLPVVVDDLEKVGALVEARVCERRSVRLGGKGRVLPWPSTTAAPGGVAIREPTASILSPATTTVASSNTLSPSNSRTPRMTNLPAGARRDGRRNGSFFSTGGGSGSTRAAGPALGEGSGSGRTCASI